MAEGGEKTEKATPHRLQEARQKGQTSRSPEVTSAVTLLAILVTLRYAIGSSSVGGGVLLEYLRVSLSTLNQQEPGAVARFAGLTLLRSAGLVLAVAALAGFVSSLAQVGFLWTFHPLTPDFSKINPMNGAKRFFGTRGLIEGVKAMLKVVIVGGVAFTTVRAHFTDLLALPMLPAAAIFSTLGELIYTLALRVCISFFILSIGDYAYQRLEFEKSMRMSKEEIKQEHKQSDGDPLIKSQIRQRQRAMSRRRMMADVPKADVIITNPTHFAVALAYDPTPGSGSAPRVLAKGADAVAAKIREIAQQNDVPLFENPPLARALHKDVEIGHEIPAALYAAVAEVLAYVYRRNRSRRGSAIR